MNILPKKRWHVRTKENMARVRRDEAKAAEEEKARADRVSIADNEDRVRRMKMRRQDPFSSANAAGSATQSSALYEMGLISGAGELDYSQATAGQKHVNLFAELEMQERKNLTIGNKDYAAEKKKERDEWESKMGIMKRFAEDTKEFAKEKYWWEKIPLVREGQSGSKPAATIPDTGLRHTTKPAERPTSSRLETTEAVAKKRKKEEHSGRKPHRHHRDEREREAVKKERAERTEVKLERLRAERLQRERLEHQRASNLMASASAAGIKKEEEERRDRRHDHEFEVRQRLEQERSSGYNSQFNPDFARPRRIGEGGSRR